jgi:hypothetical protein
MLPLSLTTLVTVVLIPSPDIRVLVSSAGSWTTAGPSRPCPDRRTEMIEIILAVIGIVAIDLFLIALPAWIGGERGLGLWTWLWK